MRKLVFILLFFITSGTFAQQTIKTRQVIQDTIRVKDLSAVPDSMILYGTIYGYNDSLWFLDQNNVSYNLLRWLDSLAVHSTLIYANLDSIIRHTVDYYTLQDTVINNMDSIVNHTVRYYEVLDSLIRHTTNYYTLQDTVIQNMADIAALATGDDHIANDTYFTGINNAGDTANVWKINQDNNFELGIPWLLESQNSEADAGIIYRNIPLRNLNYGDSVGFRDRAGGFELWKAWGIVDGSDGLASVGLTVNGTLLADNVSGTNTGDQDLSTLRDSVGNNMDSIANHTVRYYAVLDSLARHTVDYYTLQDSVINNMDSIASHSTNYYSLRDSVINNMDSITNHTVRYYDILDSLIVHDGHYYSLRDSVANNMDSIVNHTTRYYGVLDSLARHTVDYYTLQDTVVNNMDSIVTHTTRYYGVLDSLIRHTDDYYTLQDSVIQNMADIAAIEAGDDHIDNDTWFTADNYAGDSGNAWKVSEDNTFEIGFPWLLESRNSEADAGIIYRNVPFRNLNYGDSVGFRDRAGGFELMKLWGITDGSDGLASRGMTVNGTLLADNLSGTNTGDQDISGVAANLDSIQRHTTNYYTLQDSVINNMDSIVNHTVRYYDILDSLIVHDGNYYSLRDTVRNEMDSTVNHTVRYYGILDSLIVHDGNYYSLRDTVRNEMDSTVNHTVRYYGILDSLIVHDGNYYSLRDSVINNMDSIVNHTVRYYGILDSLIVHNDNYYTLRDTVIQNMADIAAIEAGENDIDNDTWFTGDNYAGDSGNAWQVTKDNTIDFGYPLLLKSQNSADNIVWKNLSLRGLNYGDSAKYVYRAGGFELFKAWGLADGSDGLASRGFDILGDISADNLAIANWNTAYGWGNPSGTYLPLAGGTMVGNTINNDDVYNYFGTSSDAWNMFNGTAYAIGANASNIFIGNQSNSDEYISMTYNGGNGYTALNYHGTAKLTTANTGIVLSSGATVNEFSTDGTLADDSDAAVPTEQAVKEYVDSKIRTIKVPLSSADITSLYSSPKQIVAAVAGDAIEVLGAVFYFHGAGNTAYTTSSLGIYLGYSGSAWQLVWTEDLITAASDKIVHGTDGGVSNQNYTTVPVGQALNLWMDVANPAGGGDATADLYVTYRIIDL